MSELPPNIPDGAVAEQFRYAVVNEEGKAAKDPFDVSDTGLLDKLVESADAVSRNEALLSGLPSEVADKLSSGTHVLAGFNMSGEENGTAIEVMERERFDAILVHFLGSEAVEGYQSSLSRFSGDVDQEEAPVNEVEQIIEEPPRLTLGEAFKSPEAFTTAMSNPESDPDLRRELSAISRAWQELRVSQVTDETWEELIVPKLQELSEIPPKVTTAGRNAVEQLETLSQGLSLLATAVEYQDYEEIGQLANRFRFGIALQEVEADVVATLGQGELGQAGHKLDFTEIEADERVQRVVSPLVSGVPSEAQVEEMVEELGELARSGATAAQIKEAIDERYVQSGGKQWRSRQSDIKDIVDFARHANNVVAGNMIQRTLQNIRENLEYQLSRGVQGINGGDVLSVKAAIDGDLTQNCQQMVKLAAIIEIHAQDIR